MSNKNGRPINYLTPTSASGSGSGSRPYPTPTSASGSGSASGSRQQTSFDVDKQIMFRRRRRESGGATASASTSSRPLRVVAGGDSDSDADIVDFTIPRKQIKRDDAKRPTERVFVNPVNLDYDVEEQNTPASESAAASENATASASASTAAPLNKGQVGYKRKRDIDKFYDNYTAVLGRQRPRPLEEAYQKENFVFDPNLKGLVESYAASGPGQTILQQELYKSDDLYFKNLPEFSKLKFRVSPGSIEFNDSSIYISNEQYTDLLSVYATGRMGRERQSLIFYMALERPAEVAEYLLGSLLFIYNMNDTVELKNLVEPDKAGRILNLRERQLVRLFELFKITTPVFRSKGQVFYHPAIQTTNKRITFTELCLEAMKFASSDKNEISYHALSPPALRILFWITFLYKINEKYVGLVKDPVPSNFLFSDITEYLYLRKQSGNISDQLHSRVVTNFDSFVNIYLAFERGFNVLNTNMHLAIVTSYINSVAYLGDDPNTIERFVYHGVNWSFATIDYLHRLISDYTTTTTTKTSITSSRLDDKIWNPILRSLSSILKNQRFVTNQIYPGDLPTLFTYEQQSAEKLKISKKIQWLTQF